MAVNLLLVAGSQVGFHDCGDLDRACHPYSTVDTAKDRGCFDQL